MKQYFPEISTRELTVFINEKRGYVFDVRSSNAYNGWKYQNETRGGHIKGAKSLPSKWGNYIDWIEIVRSKGILPIHNIVLYGYEPEDAQKIARLFYRAGYNKLEIYTHFIDEWSANEGLPMDFLPGYRNLVPADWINNIVSGATPSEIKGKNIVICHAHYRNREAYISGHIPGAIDIDTLALEAPETWNRRSPEEIERALLEHGINADTTVVLYGKYMHPNNVDEFPGSAAGDIGAIRCAFIMLYAGVKDVRVLNGGFQSWQDAGFDIRTDDVEKTPTTNFGVSIPANPKLAVDIAEAKELLASDDGELVSVRSWSEFIGQVSGYNYIEKKGRIPGAIFGNCGSDAYHMENYRNVDHTIREYHEIAKIWADAGITPNKHLGFYCGTGWRGSEAFFNAWLMGWPRVSVFDGGWFEWSNDPENLYEVGEPVLSEKIS